MRVVIGEDEALLRQGVVRLLQDAGFEVVAEAADAPDLLRKVRAHRPGVAIVDVQLPPDNTDDGLRAALEIRAGQPGVGVLVLSQFADERYALDLIAARRASGTCSRTAWPTSRCSPTPCAGWAPADRRSTRRSSRACWAGGAARTRWRRSPRASAKRSSRTRPD